MKNAINTLFKIFQLFIFIILNPNNFYYILINFCIPRFYSSICACTCQTAVFKQQQRVNITRMAFLDEMR